MKEEFGSAAEIPNKPNDCDNAFRDPNAPDVLHLFTRKSGLPDRMVVQQGVFTVCRNIGGDTEQILKQRLVGSGESGKENYRRLILPAKIKPAVMRQLRATNLTSGSLFPGIDGLGQSIDELVRWR